VAESPLTRIDGSVRRPGGRSTVWVNGEAIAEGAQPDGPRFPPQRSSPGQVSIPLGESQQRIDLRVGETLDRGSGEVRDVIGEGQHVDISQHEANAYVNRGFLDERGVQMDWRMRRAQQGIECKDGKYILPSMIFTSPQQWLLLVKWLKSKGVGQQMWHLDSVAALEDLRKSVPRTPGGGPPMPGLHEALSEVAATMNANEICPIGQSMGFTWTVYNAPDELMEDEQLLHRGFFQKIYHPEHKASFTYAGEPYKFSKAGWRIRRRTPLLGEDNVKLNELMSDPKSKTLA
jgi:crotonobetainyl-CoA:carnitine CoA-transferase CaiB-like acyl-CoA transferase